MLLPCHLFIELFSKAVSSVIKYRHFIKVLSSIVVALGKHILTMLQCMQLALMYAIVKGGASISTELRNTSKI